MIPDMTPPTFSAERLSAARALISGAVHRTPLLRSSTLSDRAGVDVWLKCENLQKTGAFKVRGALHRLRTLSRDERARGVSTISAGNHAQAVAWAATAAGVDSLVVMPEHASPTKVRASREYGAEVILHGTASEAFERVREISEERDLTFVHPFDDEEVVAGHASCGTEILEDLPDVGSILVPVGGGGLSSGIAVALEAAGHGATLWGVEPTGADAMHRSLKLGSPVHLESVDTVADGLGAPMAGALNFELLQRRADGVVLVDDDQILEAMFLVLQRTKLLVEPAGAAGVAALLSGALPVEPEGPVVIVLSGGNADLDRLSGFVDRASGVGDHD